MALQLAADVKELFRDAAALSRPEVAAFILRFIAEPPVYKESSWHSEEVQTEEGVGIIDWGGEDYNPTHDLKALAAGLADLVASDRYQPHRVAVASELPFSEKALGVAAISALLRPTEHPQHHAYELEVFLAESENEQRARSLRDRVGQVKPTDHTVMTAFADGPLLCLLVARCRVRYLRSIESPEALARFEEGVSRILRDRTVLT